MAAWEPANNLSPPNYITPGSTSSPSPSAAEVASTSQRSFSGCPSCPLTQVNVILCCSAAFRRRFHRSTFLTGPEAPFQFFFSQPSIQCLLKASVTYLESDITSTRQGAVQRFQPCNNRHQFHSVIRRFHISSGKLLFMKHSLLIHILQYGAVSAGPFRISPAQHRP